MSCDFTENVSLLIDGELPAIEVRAVERHLLECAACQQVHRDFVSLRNQIGGYSPGPAAVAPRWALARVLSTRDAATTGSAGRSSREGVFGNRRLSPAWATVLATVLIGCAFAATLFFRAQQRSTSPPRNAVAPVAKAQPSVIPAGVPPLPATAEPGSPNSNQSEKVVRHVEPKQRHSEPGETAAVVKQTNTSAQPARGGRNPGSPAPPENAAASDFVARKGSNATSATSAHIRAADTETLTAQHLEQSELLLRGFRNLRPGSQVGKADLGYERRRAQHLFYQNVLLQREADTAGDVQLATLLESLEPILLDIANLSDRAPGDDVRAIKERVERQNLVALLQINSTSLARAYE